nr:protein indeterminate-domain 12-like [Ipomoea batatas]
MLQEFKHQTLHLLKKYQNSSSSSLSSQAAMFPDQELSVSALNPMLLHSAIDEQPQKMKKKRNLPGNPDPDAEVIALSPKTLLATNRFVCEICNKGFQRDQNLQLHRRGHNLPWKLKQRSNKENRKRVYVCPEPTCVHHHPSRALGDLTGIKKHFCRKHGEKKWKCEKCSKFYAVQSDWKAHSKTCGTREYRCDCGTLFSRYICIIIFSYLLFLINN